MAHTGDLLWSLFSVDREPLAILSCTPDCKSVEDCLRFLCADRVRKWLCRGVVFLGRLLCDLSLTSSVILNLVFNLELQMQSTFVKAMYFPYKCVT